MCPTFYITDVFGNKKYSGNQLATFINCENLSTEEMQHIAAEINFSETTFIISDEKKNNGFDVRIFTPKAEINFAGHPTIGTAYVINHFILKQPEQTINLNLRVGQIPVTFENDILWMKQIEPTFGKEVSVKLLSDVLSISQNDIDPAFPIQEVSTGLPFTIVPLKNIETLKKANVNIQHYNEFCKQSNAKGIMIFCPQGHEKQQQISARVFVHYLGIPEDTATGSANGCLAGYLVKRRYLNSNSIDIKVGQGYEMERPSELALKAQLANDKISIRVGGKVISIAQGTWL